MNFLNIFEDRVSGIFGSSQMPFSFKKLAKQAAHEMEDQTLVINGADTAPALYTVLIANDDDPLIAPYYPQLASEVCQFVKAQAEKKHYGFVGEPLVRFMVDPSLKSGKFSVFAENIDHPTLARLYEEERAYLKGEQPGAAPARGRAQAPNARQQAQARPATQPPSVRQPMAGNAGMAAGAGMAGNAGMAGAAGAAGAAGMAGAGVAGAGVAAGVAGVAAAPQAADPFAVSPLDAPIPVPQTMTREQLAGLGGAAAAGAAGVAAGVAAAEGAAHMSPTSVKSMPQRPLAQLVDVVTGDTYDLTTARTVIGRERALAGVVLRDPNVSRTHAELTFTGTDWSIEDLNSTNGTLVNNRRIQRCPLRNGDMLTFGLSTFEFRG